MTDANETIGGPASEENKKTSAARTTVRDRKPAKSEKAAKGGKRDSNQDNLQKKNVDRVEGVKTEQTTRERSQLISTKLQTKEHVGKHPDEPDKHDSVEVAKVGGVAAEKIKVKTIDQKVDGEHVDTIAFPADGPKPVVGGSHPLTEGQRVQEVIDNAK